MTDADFRRLTGVLSVRALYIADGGEDFATAQVKLRDLAGSDPDAVSKLWNALVVQGQRLAEERSHLDCDELIKILDAQGIVLQLLARLHQDISRVRALTAANLELLGMRCPSRPRTGLSGLSGLLSRRCSVPRGTSP